MFLVTGGTGFIGRRVVEQLLTQHPPEAIICLVKASTIPAEMAALARFRIARVRVIDGDLDDPAVSTHPAPRVDVVFHLAANIDTAVPEAQLRVNDLGTERLLNWLKPVSTGIRILYSSSVAVIDRSGPASGPLDESSPCTPRTAYGLTKLRGERILQERASPDGYTYTILRLPTVYGPGAKPGGLFDSLFTLTARRSLASRIDWPGRTSVIYVDDVARIFLGLAKRPEAANQIYCLAHPDAPTVGELSRDIGRVSGHPVRPIRVPGWVWSVTRALLWNRVVQALVPAPFFVAFWRLSLIADDGFWFDTRKLQAIWKEPLVDLDNGLALMLAARPPATASRPA